MIRKIFPAIIMVALMGSCNKGQVDQPATATPISANAFKDEHINIVTVKMTQTANKQVLFTFTTRYEVDLKKIEVLGGTTTSNLCVFSEFMLDKESRTFKDYAAVDAKAGMVANYYMIRYITSDGSWSYSPLYMITMK